MINFDLDKLDACDLENILSAGSNITITKLDDCTLEISSTGGGGSSASQISYTITVPANWNGTPADVQAALDELAGRTKVIENSTSGTNTGDETTLTIKAKRPIKTVNGQSLEGSGNVVIGVSVQPYSELTYTSGDLTLIEIYDSISKTTLLTTKDFTYTTGLLTQIVETDVATSGTKTTNLTYDVNDVLINIEKI